MGGQPKRGTRGLAGVEVTTAPAAKVLFGVCAAPEMECECSGSSFSLNNITE